MLTEQTYDYSDTIRDHMAATLNDTPPGEWAELSICPGPYGCPLGEPDTPPDLDGPCGCADCRVIHLYRAKP